MFHVPANVAFANAVKLNNKSLAKLNTLILYHHFLGSTSRFLLCVVYSHVRILIRAAMDARNAY